MAGHFYLSGTQVDRSDMTTRAKKIAHLLSDKGVTTGDVIAILLRNDTTLYEIVEACRYVGAYYVTLNWHGTQAELMPILTDSGAKVLIGHTDLLAKFTQPMPRELSIVSVKTPQAVLSRYTQTKTTNKTEESVIPAAFEHESLATLLSTTPPIQSEPQRFR
ncbi:MAG: AMP-binding protein, partial [Paraglaciecola chathamensis]